MNGHHGDHGGGNHGDHGGNGQHNHHRPGLNNAREFGVYPFAYHGYQVVSGCVSPWGSPLGSENTIIIDVGPCDWPLKARVNKETGAPISDDQLE